MLLVCGALFLLASIAYGDGSYQRTRDGQTFIWRDSPERGEQAMWSGKRDKNGFATGSGVLTCYKVEPTMVTGSNILDTRRYVILVNHYSGTMVRGKFEGAVTCIDANGKRLQAISDSETNRPSRRKKATRARTAKVKATPRAKQTPTPPSQQIIIDTPELTSAPTPDQGAPLGAEEPQTAEPPQTGTLVAKQMVAPPSEQQAASTDDRSTTLPGPTGSDDSLRSRSTPPFGLPKPPRTLDEHTVAKLDTLYQSAVKANDVAIMNEILSDDFVLITDRGASLTKADLIKEAQGKRTTYEQHKAEEGTQQVRIWRDTAVVTALLRIKGTRDKNPFDYKMWVSETYVRTPMGWRCVFGQPLKPDAQ